MCRHMRTHELDSLREQFNRLSQRANQHLGTFDAHSVGLGRYVPGSSPWERHTNGDELLLVTDGEVRIETLENDGNSRTELLKAGSLFVVPKGLWHQLTATANVNILYLSPSEDGAERTREHPSRGRGA